jgi:hypothetical protein
MSKFDLILEETLAERTERREQIAAMGRSPVSLEASCPTCHQLDGYLTLEDLRLGYCAAHHTMWRAGHCTITDEAAQRAKWAEVGADAFTLTQGWLVGMRAKA